MLPNDPKNDGVFWHLWVRHREACFKKCLKIMGGNIAEAEDALSSAMLKAREKMLLNIDGIENFKGWALRLTENVCYDFLRKHRKMVHYGEIPDSLIENNIDDVFFLMECRETYHYQETALQEVFRMANKLPLRLREPFFLRIFLAKPYHYIADRLCISEENARKRIQQARSFLKQQYGKKISRLLTSSLQERDMDPDSLLVTKIRQDVRSFIGAQESEVDVSLTTAWIVDAPQGTGPEREILIFLPLKGGNLEKRLASLIQYVTKHPGGWKKRLELAQIYLAVGLWDKAESALRLVLNKHPRSFAAWMILGGMLAESGRGDEAASIFEEAGTVAKRVSSKEFFSGLAALSRGLGDKALHFFEKANAMEPANISFHQAIGICHLRSKRYSEALSCFSKILAERPNEIVSLAYCCEISFILDRLEDAEKYINIMLKGNPHEFYALKRREKLTNRRGGGGGETRKNMLRIMKQFTGLQRIIKSSDDKKHLKTSAGHYIPN